MQRGRVLTWSTHPVWVQHEAGPTEGSVADGGAEHAPMALLHSHSSKCIAGSSPLPTQFCAPADSKARRRTMLRWFLVQ